MKWTRRHVLHLPRLRGRSHRLHHDASLNLCGREVHALCTKLGVDTTPYDANMLAMF
jgi:hypothetical protein